ncbi:6,7-dimethyl-8-ribityllumazine synthase [Candidatus Uhrbacteria bacterium]|nr:6,7-dimethyl-8-ribityllumazine synthase [Candidatus Uhrbacteria bacterium]
MDANNYSPVDGSPFRFTIVRARFNEGVTQGLLDACTETLRGAGVRPEHVSVIEVPGSMEIGYALNECAVEGTADVLIALGAVIKGETVHFEYLASFCMDSIREVIMSQRIPVSVGVLTCFNRAQAEARSGFGPLNRGREAALAAVEMAALRRNMGWTRGV